MAYGDFAPQGSAIQLQHAGAFIPEIWSTDLLRYRRSNLVMANYVRKLSFVGKAGDMIRLPRVGRLGVRPKVPGAPVVYQSRTETEWKMFIDRYMESSFAIEDIVNIQSHTNLRTVYTEEAGRALAEDIDNFLLGQRAAVVGYAPTAHVSSANPIAYADILTAWEILNLRKVPKKGRVLAIGASQEASLLNDAKFIETTYKSDSGSIANISTGQIGTILGMPVVMTSALVANSLTGYTNGDGATPEPTPGMTGSPYFPTQYGDDFEVFTPVSLTAGRTSAIMFHPDFCVLAFQKMPRVDADWSTDYQEWHVVQTQIYGAKLYRPDHAVVISTTE